jgi:hypothetical protein
MAAIASAAAAPTPVSRWLYRSAVRLIVLRPSRLLTTAMNVFEQLQVTPRDFRRVSELAVAASEALAL